MPDLRAETLRLANSLPVGNPTRRKLLAALVAKKAAKIPQERELIQKLTRRMVSGSWFSQHEGWFESWGSNLEWEFTNVKWTFKRWAEVDFDGDGIEVVAEGLFEANATFRGLPPGEKSEGSVITGPYKTLLRTGQHEFWYRPEDRAGPWLDI